MICRLEFTKYIFALDAVAPKTMFNYYVIALHINWVAANWSSNTYSTNIIFREFWWVGRYKKCCLPYIYFCLAPLLGGGHFMGGGEGLSHSSPPDCAYEQVYCVLCTKVPILRYLFIVFCFLLWYFFSTVKNTNLCNKYKCHNGQHCYGSVFFLSRLITHALFTLTDCRTCFV